MTLKPFVLAAIISVAGCGESATAPTIDGTYRLQRVNGGPLPGILETSLTDTTRATGGTLTMNGDRTWRAEVVLSITSGGVTTPAVTTESGTYTRAGEAITLRAASDGSVVSGTLQGATLKTVIDGVSLEFERQ